MKTLKLLFGSSCLIYLLGMSACKCIEVPASDSTPPSVTLTVIYEDVSGNSNTVYVNTTDRTSPQSVSIPKENEFSIIYSSSDRGGVEETFLDWAYTTYLGGGIAQTTSPLISPTVYSGCPKTYRAETVEYPADPSLNRRVYTFTAHAKDYRDNRNVSPALTIEHK